MTAELFGPRSVTWQLHADPAMWVAGIRALFLQALHPLAVRGVMQHSDFRADPLGRLSKTANFVGATTYGTPEEAESAGARVRRVHARLRLRADDGTTYRIDDPELLRWVHCAEVASYLDVVRRAGFPLTAAQADRYLEEQRTSAALVGLDPSTVPGGSAEMAAYMADIRPALRRTSDADEIYDFLTAPPVGPPLRTGWRPIAQIAYALLPAWGIELYGRQPMPASAATASLRVLRRVGYLIPESIRWRVPVGHIPRAIKRLGRRAIPSARNLPKLPELPARPE